MIDGDASLYDKPNWCVLDVETDGHYRDLSVDLVCMVGCSASGETWSYTGDSMLPQSVANRIRSYDFIIGHQVKFEAGWLQRCGIDTRKLGFWCTMTCEWLFRAGLPAGGLGLEESCARYGLGSKDVWASSLIRRHNVKASEIPTSVALEYCKQDVLMTRDLYLAQRKRIRDE